MDKAQKEVKEFLEQQLQWCKEQDAILQLLEDTLQKMKRLAEYKLEHELSSAETVVLNQQLKELKQEAAVLHFQLDSVVH
jgi:chorismate mutase